MADHPPTPLSEMDVTAFLNMRTWFEDAIKAKGGKITDGGIGLGRADIGVDIDGCGYSVSIRPRMKD